MCELPPPLSTAINTELLKVHADRKLFLTTCKGSLAESKA